MPRNRLLPTAGRPPARAAGDPGCCQLSPLPAEHPQRPRRSRLLGVFRLGAPQTTSAAAGPSRFPAPPPASLAAGQGFLMSQREPGSLQPPRASAPVTHRDSRAPGQPQPPSAQRGAGTPSAGPRRGRATLGRARLRAPRPASGSSRAPSASRLPRLPRLPLPPASGTLLPRPLGSPGPNPS